MSDKKESTNPVVKFVKKYPFASTIAAGALGYALYTNFNESAQAEKNITPISMTQFKEHMKNNLITDIYAEKGTGVVIGETVGLQKFRSITDDGEPIAAVKKDV